MGLDLDFDLLLEKLEFVAAGGISPVGTDPDLVCIVKLFVVICLIMALPLGGCSTVKTLSIHKKISTFAIIFFTVLRNGAFMFSMCVPYYKAFPMVL